MAWPAPPPPPRPPGPPAGLLAPQGPPVGTQPPDGLGWAAVPVVTVGVGAPAAFLYAAVRRRSAALAGAGALYGVGVVGGVAGILSGNGDATLLGMLLIVLTWAISSVHALAVRPRLYPPTDTRDELNQRAVEEARRRRGLREAARQIVRDDPVLARELRIGRPDLLPRSFDDGGLIDVNHVPPEVLSRLPGLTYEMVDRIMRLRTQNGGFVSAEELAVHADLPPAIIAELAEYALFAG